MLRTNLATRPFYNERAVHVLLAVAALLVLGLSAFNAFRIISLSRANTELASRVNSEHQEADRLTAQARRSAAPSPAELTAASRRQARPMMINRRRSPGRIFQPIESTIPPEHVTAVMPGVRNTVTVVGVSKSAPRRDLMSSSRSSRLRGFPTARRAADMTQAALYQGSGTARTRIFEDPSAIGRCRASPKPPRPHARGGPPRTRPPPRHESARSSCRSSLFVANCALCAVRLPDSAGRGGHKRRCLSRRAGGRPGSHRLPAPRWRKGRRTKNSRSATRLAAARLERRAG